jgi:hypothetical protein
MEAAAMTLPILALSVRQPWAWAIIHAGKDMENRSWQAIKNLGQDVKGPRAIHASQGMTREEYEQAADFMRTLRVYVPPPADLLRGGIIGSVDVIGTVRESTSPWFFGPRALVLRDPRACEFIPAIGHLGYFPWAPCSPEIVPPPARWMLPKAQAASTDMFEAPR